MSDPQRVLRRWWWLLIPLVLAGGVWLLPISGQVVLTPRGSARLQPQMRLEPGAPEPGQETTLWVTDDTPWSHVLLTVDAEAIQEAHWEANPGGTWTWTWSSPTPGWLRRTTGASTTSPLGSNAPPRTGYGCWCA